MKNIAVIGAGLSGITCARRLESHCNVQVFDKSRGVSGRMSTRYAGAFEFDHGAQYFTAHHENFRAEVIAGIDAGQLAPWAGRALYHKSSGLEPDKGADRFTAIPRMNSWVKYLARGLNVTLATRIINMKYSGGQWMLTSQDGTQFGPFDAAVMAIPAPQAETLISPYFNAINAVKNTKMDACFALMLGFDDLPDLGWDSLRVDRGPAAWLAINHSKAGRPKIPSLVVHGAAAWSNEHAEIDREQVLSELITAASKAANFDLSRAKHQALHRWLYASVSAAPNKPCLHDAALNLALCGDWCLGGRVENAFLSGQAAGQAILESL